MALKNCAFMLSQLVFDFRMRSDVFINDFFRNSYTIQLFIDKKLSLVL